MTGDETQPPDTPALEAWYEKYPYDERGSDLPRISVWMPQSPPHANLQTIGRGCQEPDVLPDGPIFVQLDVAGGITIGGYLDEIEQYIDACRDALRFARWQSEQLERASDVRDREAGQTDE